MANDNTRYDVHVNGALHENMPKRHAMLQIVRTLVCDGVSPRRVTEVLGRSEGTLWRVVDGHVTADEFIRAATAAAKDGGLKFDPSWWAYKRDELMHHNGRTYALSRNWRAPEFIANVKDLGRAFPQYGISIQPTVTSPRSRRATRG